MELLCVYKCQCVMELVAQGLDVMGGRGGRGRLRAEEGMEVGEAGPFVSLLEAEADLAIVGFKDEVGEGGAAAEDLVQVLHHCWWWVGVQNELEGLQGVKEGAVAFSERRKEVHNYFRLVVPEVECEGLSRGNKGGGHRWWVGGGRRRQVWQDQ
jgi:hypothetical protein